MVAGWRDPAELEPPLPPRRPPRLPPPQRPAQPAPRGARRLRLHRTPVWHCVARAAPGDRMLSDDEWAQIARRDHAPHRPVTAGAGRRRGPLDRRSGTATTTSTSWPRSPARTAPSPASGTTTTASARPAEPTEDRYGLHPTAPGDRTAARRPTRAENEKARRNGRPEPARVTLKRHVATAAAAAASEQEFFAHLQQAGVLVRTRLSTRNPGQITGYAVALPSDTTKAGRPVWYSGGKLAADLTLPKLRHRWHPTAGGTAPHRAGAHLGRTQRHLGTRRPHRRPRHRADPPPRRHRSRRRGRRRLGRRRHPARRRRRPAAAGSSARPPTATTAPPAPRTAASPAPPRPATASATPPACSPPLGMVTGDRTHTAIALILRLAALAETVADLRHLQQRAAQAAAARTAAERLRAAASPSTPPPPRGPGQTRPRTAAGLAGASFPTPPNPRDTAPPTQDPRTPTQPATPPRRSTPVPRPRGPTR